MTDYQNISPGYACVPNAVLKDPTLSPTVKTLYAVGATYLQGGKGSIFPSYRRLAELCGFCRRTAIRAAKELERRGLWKIERRRNDETMVCQTNLVSYAAPGDSRVTTPGDSRVTTPVTQSHPCIKNQPYQDPGLSTRADARGTLWGGRVRDRKREKPTLQERTAAIMESLRRKGAFDAQ